MPLKKSRHPAGRALDPQRGPPVLRPLGQTAGQLSKKTATCQTAPDSIRPPGSRARARRQAAQGTARAGLRSPGRVGRPGASRAGAREPAQVRERPGADLPSQRARSRGPCRPRSLSPSPSCRRRPGPPSRVGEAPALRRPGQRPALRLLPRGPSLRSGVRVGSRPLFYVSSPGPRCLRFSPG